MKQFFKFTLASCLGVFIAFFALLVFSSLIIGGIASSFSTQGTTKISSKSVLKINLDKTIPELTNNGVPETFNFQDDDILGLQDIVRLIEKAAEDDKISALLIKTTNPRPGMASLDLVADAIETFKASNKPVVAYSDYYTQKGLRIASEADHVILSKVGGIDFRGFGVIIPFFTNTLDKIGVDMQIYYAGDFKSATEPFRLTEMSEQNRKQVREYLDDTYQIYLSEISENRDIPVSDLHRFADEYMLNLPQDALQLGMVDALGYPGDGMKYIRERLGMDEKDDLDVVTLNRYASSVGNLIRGSEDNRIAILYAEGEIRAGDDNVGIITEKRYLKAIEQITKDESIKAVVLRVNSPGGSVVISEHILNALEEMQSKGKTLVVSMGDVAASGGYYISCKADEIFVQPNTITGSIGVFGIIPNVRELMEDKMGITFDTVGTSPYATRLNAIYEFNNQEDDIIQEVIDHYYQEFLKLVAEGRNMSVEEVHKIAQGRVWTGRAAVQNGLADEIGGLNEAIERASELAGIEAYKLKEFPRMRSPLEQLITDLFGEDAIPATARIEVLPKELKELRKYEYLLQDRNPQAKLLYEFQY